MAKRMTKYQMMTEEYNQVSQAATAVKKKMEGTGHQAKALLTYVEGEIKKLQAEPPSSTRDRKIYLNEIRRQGALCNMELLDTIVNINPNAGISVEILAHIDALTAKSQYLTIDFQVTAYRRIIEAIERALASDGDTGPLNAPAAPAAGRGTGSLNRPAGPNRLQQGAAGRTQAGPRVPQAPQAGGTGRLQPPARPGANANASTGPLKPGAAAPQAGSGRLPTGPLKPGQARPGSGPLGRGTGQLPANDPAMMAIKKAAADPTSRQLLQELVSRHQDLDSTVAQIRGDAPGTLGVSLLEVGNLVKQAAAKVYYLERVLQQLGPLGEQIPFQNWNTDPNVLQMLQTLQPEPAAPAKPGAQQQDAGAISGFLKSLFK